MTQDGARVAIRVDVYQGDRLVCFHSSREHTTPLATHDEVSIASKVHNAISGVIAEQPLF